MFVYVFKCVGMCMLKYTGVSVWYAVHGRCVWCGVCVCMVYGRCVCGVVYVCVWYVVCVGGVRCSGNHAGVGSVFACEEARNQQWMSSIISLTLFSETGSFLLNLAFITSARLVGQKLRRSACHCIPRTREFSYFLNYRLLIMLPIQC